jgi:hypothetical protein
MQAASYQCSPCDHVYALGRAASVLAHVNAAYPSVLRGMDVYDRGLHEAEVRPPGRLA